MARIGGVSDLDGEGGWRAEGLSAMQDARVAPPPPPPGRGGAEACVVTDGDVAILLARKCLRRFYGSARDHWRSAGSCRISTTHGEFP